MRTVAVEQLEGSIGTRHPWAPAAAPPVQAVGPAAGAGGAGATS